MLRTQTRIGKSFDSVIFEKKYMLKEQIHIKQSNFDVINIQFSKQIQLTFVEKFMLHQKPYFSTK